MFLITIHSILSLFILFYNYNTILVTCDAVSFNNFARNAHVFNEYHIPKNYSTAFNEFIIPRVVGGRTVGLGQVPYQVSFKRYWNRSYRNFCGGCLIKPAKVVSAAHCFIRDGPNFFFYQIFNIRFFLRPLSQIYAHAGTLSTSWPKVEEEDSAIGGQWRRLYDCYYPRSYKFPFADIAVVILKTPFVLNNYVSAIGYAKLFNEYINTKCIVSGFGKVQGNKIAPTLMEAELRIITDYECSYLYGRKMTKFICTTDNFTDVSQGDSGGPLVCTTGPKGAKELIGVVSGKALGRSSFFTRVAAYKGFIESPGEMSMSPLTKYCVADTAAALWRSIVKFL